MAEDDMEIFRRVYFFRIEHFADIKESLPGAFSRIANLEFTDEGRYKFDKSTKIRLSAYPDTDSYPLKVRFCRIRRDNLPQVERVGGLALLNIQEDEGLIDIGHLIIFEEGYVAAEWNPEAPKIGLLGSYIFEKGRLNTAPRFLSLLERDIVEVVRALSSAKVLEIDLPPDSIDFIREADPNLAQAIAATTAMGATKRTGFVLSADKPTAKLRDIATKLATLIKSHPQEGRQVKTLKIKGYNQGSKLANYIDILESKLLSGAYLPRTSGRSRSVKTHETYSIIEQLYIANKQRIMAAAETADMP
jgi:hypothetical protein